MGQRNASQFWVRGQGHDGVKYAGNSTFWACYHAVLRSISRIFTKLTPVTYYGTEMNALNFGVKGHSSGRGGITYAGTITVQAEAYSTGRLVLS